MHLYLLVLCSLSIIALIDCTCFSVCDIDLRGLGYFIGPISQLFTWWFIPVLRVL